MKMPKDWCLKQCRFYKGEKECPERLKSKEPAWADAWFMEKLWVEAMIKNGSIPVEFADQYNRAGLGEFNFSDGVPIDLKEFLYGYSLHRSDGMLTADEFKTWYDYKYIPFGDYYKGGQLKE